jgi:hypothetical protein
MARDWPRSVMTDRHMSVKCERTIMKWTVSGMLMLTGAIVTVTAAHASTQIHGSVCVNDGGTGVQQQSVFGPYNSSSSGVVLVRCTLSRQSTGSTRHVSVIVYDRNPDANIGCQLLGMDADGNQVFEDDLLVSIGSGSSSQTLSSRVAPSTVATFIANCNIPASAGGQFSHVTGFLVDD